MSKYLVVLAGPTASGKTTVAIKLAQAFETVVFSADSRQFYREIPIGTAAPTAEEQRQARHLFVGNLSIYDKYDVADYEREATLKLNDYFKMHDVVVMTGGSGLFIDAVCNGIDEIPDISPENRKIVNDLYENGGLLALQSEVEKNDPEYYKVVDKQNPRRLQRAIEVFYQTGLPYSKFRTKKVVKRDFQIVKLALLCDRAELINRINRRVEAMMSQGLIEEARAVYPARHLNTLNTVGYKELFDYFDGNCNLEEAVERIKVNTRQYAKRQMTWLRKNNDYQWFAPNEVSNMIEFVKSRMSQ